MMDINEFWKHCLPRTNAQRDLNGNVTFKIIHPTRVWSRNFMITSDEFSTWSNEPMTNDNIIQNPIFRNCLIKSLEQFAQDLREKKDLECIKTTEYLREQILDSLRPSIKSTASTATSSKEELDE